MARDWRLLTIDHPDLTAWEPKFVFMRNLDGQPFLTVESDNVRFFAQFTEKLKLNVKYKVADMVYDGKLEY